MMTNEQVLEKMEEDFLLRGSSEKTKETYLTALKRFSEFAGKQDRLAELNQDDLRAFLLHLRKDCKLQGTSINTYNAGCKFFLEVCSTRQSTGSRSPMYVPTTSSLSTSGWNSCCSSSPISTKSWCLSFSLSSTGRVCGPLS